MRIPAKQCCALFVVLLALLSSLITPTASASNFNVNSLDDLSDVNTSDGICSDGVGDCTLRAAIEQANASASADLISIGVTGTINLNSPLQDLSTNVTISGPGESRLTVRRNSADHYRIFAVAAGANVHISGLTVSDGQAPLSLVMDAPGGGGIYNAGDLTMSGVTVSNNNVPSSLQPVPFTPFFMQGGGGIQNDGALTMTDCNVTNNATGTRVNGESNVAGGNGGGIFNTGTLTMTGCSVTFNTTGNGADTSPTGGFAGSGGAGGGIYNAPNGARQVSATLTGCNVSENVTGAGGKIANGPGASLSQSGNGGAGGGVYNTSNMTIASSIVSGNLTGVGASVDAGIAKPAGKGGAGGGIYNDIPSGGGEMKIVNCVVRDNKTGQGGKGNDMLLSEGNGGDGGGIANPSNNSVLKVSQSTIVFNQAGLAGDDGGRDGVGGGIYGVPRIRSNIIALNVVRFPLNTSDVAGGPILSSGLNYVGYFGGFCCFAVGDQGGTDSSTPFILKLDANLIPLPDSPVIDKGLARDLDDHPVTTDIRGAARPFDFPDVAPQIGGGDNGDSGAFERQPTDPLSPLASAANDVHFSSATGEVTEGCVQTFVSLARTGPLDGRSEVTYTVTGQTASQRGDFTYAQGHVTLNAGEPSTSIPVLISEDAYAEGPETLTVAITALEGGTLGTPSSVTLQINDDDATDGAANPIDDSATFVCQHYHDFLNRQADTEGQAFWTGQLDACNGDPRCLDRKRADVSAAFFLSIEFQNTGYYVIRTNKAAFGDAPGDAPGNPSYLPFLEETRRVGDGVIVGRPNYQALLEFNKQRYAEAFVERADFQAAHGGQTATQYVDSLFANAGVTPTTVERDAAINAFGGGDTPHRAASLRAVIESGSVYNKLYNEAFVLMQYFAYLRRNPNAPPDSNFDGYLFWLEKLDGATLPGEDARDETIAIRRIRRAEMVRAFLRSAEYRGRFAGDPSRGNP